MAITTTTIKFKFIENSDLESMQMALENFIRFNKIERKDIIKIYNHSVVQNNGEVLNKTMIVYESSSDSPPSSHPIISPPHHQQEPRVLGDILKERKEEEKREKKKGKIPRGPRGPYRKTKEKKMMMGIDTGANSPPRQTEKKYYEGLDMVVLTTPRKKQVNGEDGDGQ